jgi:hypothetical protein
MTTTTLSITVTKSGRRPQIRFHKLSEVGFIGLAVGRFNLNRDVPKAEIAGQESLGAHEEIVVRRLRRTDQVNAKGVSA